MYIPVNCAIVAQVYKDIMKSTKLMPKTMTQLYTILIRIRIKRHMIEKGIWDEESPVPNLHDLPVEVAAPYKRISEIAYKGLQDMQLDFTEADVGENFEHLGLLSETKELYVCEGAKSTYSFLHLSIQEFLAAWRISCRPGLIDNLFSATFYKSCATDPHNKTLALFMAGLIGCDKFGPGITAGGLTFMSTCLFEAQDCSILEKQPLRVGENLIIPSNHIEMYAFGYVLAKASIQWHLTHYDFVPLTVLSDSLSEHAEIKGSIVGLRLVPFIPNGDRMLSLQPPLTFVLKSLLYLSI